MKFLFRVDASIAIGSGHVMRCLTLADALRRHGADCHFVCRAHAGHLIDSIRQRGFETTALAAGSAPLAGTELEPDAPAHAAWLECAWQKDARQTRDLALTLQPDWLVVDHYALDARWENAVRDARRKLLAIDDLADRSHACDVLMDQNLGRTAAHYAGLVSPGCRVLAGPDYALLRPEFMELRSASLARRHHAALRHVFVNMGGVDQPNATGEVLAVLRECALPPDCRVSVVMGMQAIWIAEVREMAAAMPWPTEVLVNVTDMAERMAASDLAIGAAGGTAWERCCLGLPTLLVVLAANQEAGAAALEQAGAAVSLGRVDQVRARLPAALAGMMQAPRLDRMGQVAAGLVDGQGAGRILRALEI